MEHHEKHKKLEGFLKEEKRFIKELEKIDVDKNWSRFISDLEIRSEFVRNYKQVKRYRFIFRYAAAILFLLAVSTSIYLFSLKDTQQILRVRAGLHQMNLELNDGTAIYLNKDAELSYPEKLNRKKREVNLSGEAFFEVKHAERSPFYIYIEEHVIKVLGTSFNVKEDEAGNIIVNVKEGIVSFYTKEKEEEEVRITVGQSCIFNAATGEYTIEKVRSPNYLFWKTGNLNYKDENLSEVFRELESLFGQKIVVPDPSILSNKWNSTHIGEDLFEILNELCLYFDLKYIEEEDVIYIQKLK